MLQTIKRWWPDVALLAAFVALTVALIAGHLLTLDQRVADWAFGHQPSFLYWSARVLNYFGQGGQVLSPAALLLSIWLAWRSKSARAFLPFIGAYLITYATIGPLKIWAGRAAPRFSGPDKTIMFNPHASGAEAVSYPSGHMGNSLVWYATIAVLVAALAGHPLSRRRLFAIRVLPVMIVFCTTVYTGFHWLTDSVAGLLLGVLLARLLDRVRWDAIPLPRAFSRPAGFIRPGS